MSRKDNGLWQERVWQAIVPSSQSLAKFMSFVEVHLILFRESRMAKLIHDDAKLAPRSQNMSKIVRRKAAVERVSDPDFSVPLCICYRIWQGPIRRLLEQWRVHKGEGSKAKMVSGGTKL